MFKILSLALVATAVLAAPNSKLESRLISTLASKGVADILISYQSSTDRVLSTFKTASFPTRTDRINSVVSALQAHARSQQHETQALLKTLKVQHEVLWITNQVWIRNASASLVSKLMNLPEISKIVEDVEEIYLDPIIPGSSGVENFVRPKNQEILNEWGVDRVSAPQAWALGLNGTGAIVGVVDTGVRASHVDLASNFAGTNYGWRDFTLFGTQTPRDDHGHGTHCAGSILGQNGIGVAPGATLVACKALNSAGGATQANLIACGQFMACPTLPNGQSPDCSRAPHIVSNSWGGGQANTFYNQVLNALHAVGIIPVFANGNSGSNCVTANSPADSVVNVIAVGALNNTNELSWFSSRGPTLLLRRVKPDISAPGADIRSTWTGADNAYNTISGTSMAAPHVAGVVALLRGANQNLTYDQIYSAITDNADRNVVDSGAACGGIAETQFPNNAYGSGVVNALAALQSLNLTRVD